MTILFFLCNVGTARSNDTSLQLYLLDLLTDILYRYFQGIVPLGRIKLIFNNLNCGRLLLHLATLTGYLKFLVHTLNNTLIHQHK